MGIDWSGWATGLGIALGVWVVLCVAMTVLARRLRPGLVREVTEFLPACVTTARRLRGAPGVPPRAKVALLVAVIWVLSPIDLLPEFLPVIGPFDDVVAVVLLLRYTARTIPRDQLLAAWQPSPDSSCSSSTAVAPIPPSIPLRLESAPALGVGGCGA